MFRFAGRPRVHAGLAALALVVGAAAWAASAGGARAASGDRAGAVARSTARQAAQVAVVTAIDPDTTRVGEPVMLGVTVRTPEARSVGFPALLPLADPLEQQGAIEQRPRSEGDEWRAYYRIVAWQAGEHSVPPFEIAVRSPRGEQRLEVGPVPFYVASVLPADTAGLELREARPLLRITGPSWTWLLLLALGAALLLWLWRRRATPASAAPPPSPFEQALESLRRLRRRWQEGGLTAPELYDGLEGTLRGYAAATRAWLPGASLQRLTNGDRALAAALARSVLVRFARVAPSGDTALASIDAGESWIREDAEGNDRAALREERRKGAATRRDSEGRESAAAREDARGDPMARREDDG